MTSGQKIISLIAFVAGVILLFLSGVYFSTTADALPSYMPGYDVTLHAIHFKHALGCLILGIAAFIFVWFQTAPEQK